MAVVRLSLCVKTSKENFDAKAMKRNKEQNKRPVLSGAMAEKWPKLTDANKRPDSGDDGNVSFNTFEDDEIQKK